MLKILNFSFQKYVIIIAVILCFGSVAFCLYKVIFALITKPISQSKMGWSPQKYSKPFEQRTIHEKDVFVLKLVDFSTFSEQTSLVEGKNYFILKILEQNEEDISCLYGTFNLIKKHQQHLNFKSLNRFNGKKIEQYGIVLSKKIKYRILDIDQLPSRILNCKNWIHVNNRYEFLDQKMQTKKQVDIKFKKHKCIMIPSTNIIATQSSNPNVAYFEYNDITNKLKLCIQKPGDVFVRYMTVNSGNYEAQHLKIR